MASEFSMSTPALLFPAISLLMLAFTNRFLACASVVRNLHDQYRRNPDDNLLLEVRHLRHRLHLIRVMQMLAILSILTDMVSMFFLFEGARAAAEWSFAGSLVLMIGSLAVSAREIHISVVSVELHIRDMLREDVMK